MQVAELLSDLTSLRPEVCDPKAAFAIVSVRPDEPSPSRKLSLKDDGSDPDLKRAKDLMELHATVKLAHADGTDKILEEAREAVSKVLREL